MTDQPPTVEQATALYEENQRLREGLGVYGRHLVSCPSPHAPNSLCNCGLSALLGEGQEAG